MSQTSIELVTARFTMYVRSLLEADPYLADKFLELCPQIPTPFWTAPASSSGKHHPPFASGLYGLVRHTVAVIHVATDISRLWLLDTPKRLPLVVFAAAAHDTVKGGMTVDTEWKTRRDHPILAADLISSLTDEDDDGTNNIKLLIIAQAVSNHMSLWGPRHRSLVQSAGTIASLSAVIVVADYIVSRSYFSPAGELSRILRAFEPESIEEMVGSDR